MTNIHERSFKNILFFVIFATFISGNCTYAKDYENLKEIEVLRKIPENILRNLMQAGMPDSSGLVGRNRDGWVHVAFQRGAGFSFVAAIALRDYDAAEKAWGAIEFSFSKQTEEGNFELGEFMGKKPTSVDDYSGVSFWLASVSRAILIARESEFSGNFKERIEILLPKIGKSANWLLKHKEELKQYDSRTANRLFFDAVSFGLCGLVLNKDGLIDTGNNFLEAGLSLQRSDGVLLEKEGYDSSYQATSLINMQVYMAYFPDKKLENAITKAFQWEMGRINEYGEVNTSGNTRIGQGQEELLGKRKEVSYQDVVLSLFYYGIFENNHNAVSLAEKVYNYKKGHSGN